MSYQNSPEAAAAEHRARSKASENRPAPSREWPSEALIFDRCKANIEGQGQDVRQPIAKTTTEATELVRRALSNPALGNDAQRILYIAPLAKSRMEGSLTLLEVRRDITTREKARVAAAVEAAYLPRNPAHAAIAGELRSMLRGMSDAERDNVLHSMKGTADYIPLMYAVASAPAALSGVPFGQQIGIREMALAIANPELLSLPAAIEDELKLLDEAEEGLRRTYAELVDWDAADALKELSTPPA